MVDVIVGKKGTKRKVRWLSTDEDKWANTLERQDKLDNGPNARTKREEANQIDKAREIGLRQAEDLLCEYPPSPPLHPPPSSSLSPSPPSGEPPLFPIPFSDPRVDCHVIPVPGT